MIPRLVLATALAIGALAPTAGPARADTRPVDTILRQHPVDDGVAVPAGLGPTRLQGDFDAVLAAVTDSGATAPTALSAAATMRRERQPNVVLPVTGGLVGGAVGLYGGAVTGGSIADRDGSGDLDFLGGAIIGGVLGEAFLLPLGVHLGNARKGSYLADLGISLLTAAAGWGLIVLTDSPAIAAAAAVVHLGIVVGAERKVADGRIAERAP